MIQEGGERQTRRCAWNDTIHYKHATPTSQERPCSLWLTFIVPSSFLSFLSFLALSQLLDLPPWVLAPFCPSCLHDSIVPLEYFLQATTHDAYQIPQGTPVTSYACAGQVHPILPCWHRKSPAICLDSPIDMFMGNVPECWEIRPFPHTYATRCTFLSGCDTNFSALAT